LAVEYEMQLDGLRALVELRRAYHGQNRQRDIGRVLDQVAELVERLPSTDLATTNMTRQQWLAWIENHRKSSQALVESVKSGP
jgi:hypothetical protein